MKLIDEEEKKQNKASNPNSKYQFKQISDNLETSKKNEIESSLAFINSCSKKIEEFRDRCKNIQLELNALEVKKKHLQQEVEDNVRNISFGEDVIKKMNLQLDCIKDVNNPLVLKRTSDEIKSLKEDWKKETMYSLNHSLETSVKVNHI